MTPSKRIMWALFVSCMAMTSQAQQAPASCTPIQCNEAKTNPFCIDARTGPPSESASYGHREVLLVFLVNKNPFLYDYQIKTQSRDFSKEDGDALSSFASLTGIGGEASKSTQSTKNASPQSGSTNPFDEVISVDAFNASDKQAKHGNASGACSQTLTNLDDLAQAASVNLSALQTDVATLEARLRVSASRALSADLKNAGSSGDQLCGRAVNLRDSLQSFQDGRSNEPDLAGPAVASALKIIDSESEALTKAITQYKSQVANILRCDPDNCEGRYQVAFKSITQCQSDADYEHALGDRRSHDNDISALEASASELKSRTVDLKSANCQLESTLTQLDGTLNDDTSFFQRVGPFGPYADSEDIGLKITRSPKKAATSGCEAGASSANPAAEPKKSSSKPNGSTATQTPVDPALSVANVTLHFGGGQRIYAAAGPVVSFLRVKEFQRATGVTDTGANATIVDYKTNSPTRVSPVMGFVHWRPLDADWFFLTLGATAKSDNQKTSAEFLFGPTIGFIGNRVFLTAGGYLGQQQRLDGNLSIGQTVPASLQGEIPIQESYRWSAAFSINFKIAGGTGSTATKTKSKASSPSTKSTSAAKP